MIRGVTADRYASEREMALPFLENFAERDPYGATVKELEAEILARRSQLWCVDDWKACMITRVTPEAVTIERLAGSDRDGWQNEVAETVAEWAKALGKKRIVAVVRPGWVPLLRKLGYTEKHREMRLEL